MISSPKLSSLDDKSEISNVDDNGFTSKFLLTSTITHQG